MDENSCILCGAHTYPTDDNEAMDGLVCPDCLRKLSPFFTDLDIAETDELRQQLQAREVNRQSLSFFRPTRKFGDDTMVLVDDSAQTFLVTDRRDFRSDDPDLIRLADVMDCSCYAEEEKTKLDGNRIRYSFVFSVTVTLEDSHPYLPGGEFTFPLNVQPLVLEGAKGGFLGRGGFKPEEDPAYQELDALAVRICDVLNRDEEEGADNTPYLFAPRTLDAAPTPQPVPEAPAPQPAAPSTPTVCPWCGSPVTPTPGGTCPLCDGPM